MPRLTVGVIGTFYGRHDRTQLLVDRLYRESSRKPDEAWLMAEGLDDHAELTKAAKSLGRYTRGLRVVHYPTPRSDNGSYGVIPYSNKINMALDHLSTDLVVYLDNGSMPHPDKLAVMAKALEDNPEWGAVYCGQLRTGFAEMLSATAGPVEDAYCNLNYTQVMHRRTDDRWPTDMVHADPDLADALFWRKLHASLGDFHPAHKHGWLDEHHIPDSKAVGLYG